MVMPKRRYVNSAFSLICALIHARAAPPGKFQGSNGDVVLQELGGHHSSGKVLTDEDARAIYNVKRNGKGPQDATRLGEQYGITAKSIRDVWNHRTWTKATVSLWKLEDVTNHVHKNLCIDCRNAGVSLENCSFACSKCTHFVREITSLRLCPQNSGSVARSDALASDDDATVTRALLRYSSWNQIWCRQDSLHGGLMQEALNFLEQNSGPY